MKRNLLNHFLVITTVITTARSAVFSVLAVALMTTVSMPVLAENQNEAILPPSMRAKVKVAEEQSVLSPKETDNYRLFEEWKKSKGQKDVEYEEFLLWQDFIKIQKKG